jgi:hypothetical protein
MYLENQGLKVKYDLSATEPGNLDVDLLSPISNYLQGRTVRFSRYMPAPFGRIGYIARGYRRIFGIKKFLANTNPHGSVPQRLIQSQLLDGYWQRNEYASFLADFLSIHFKHDPCLKSREELVVHIRRGDFVGLGLNLDLDFYKRAISTIFEMNQNLTSVILVTDDRAFCEANFSEYSNLEIFKGNNFVEDFLFLAKANYLLISRSTFSWWAARIGEKTVFFPSPWDSDDATPDTAIVPLDWIPISHT